MHDPIVLQRVTQAIDARLKQYTLDKEPLDPVDLAKIALTIADNRLLPGDIVISRRRS